MRSSAGSITCDSIRKKSHTYYDPFFNCDVELFMRGYIGPAREYLRELCYALRPLNKIWSAAVSIDVTDDPSLIRTMALAGCTGVFIGFESLRDEKPRRRTEEDAEDCRLCAPGACVTRHRHPNNGSFVLGFDHNRKDVFICTAEWIEDNRLGCATFHIVTPYPATSLFKQMEATGASVASRLESLRYRARWRLAPSVGQKMLVYGFATARGQDRGKKGRKSSLK
jgi:radical SAM superfamily enzyme YgiQ (UPF0313 family)